MKKVNYLRISVTDRCNFHCVYCAPEREKRKLIPHREILNYEEIADVVSALKEFGVKSVRITGGEPLLRKDVEELISKLKDLGIPDVSMTTNGYFLESKAKVLKERGLDRVNVSIDSLDRKKFARITGTREDYLQRVLRGIDRALEVGLAPVKVNTVLIKDFTEKEIENFIRFSEEKGIEIRFIELMPVGSRDFQRENFVSCDRIKELISSKFGSLIPVSTKGEGPARSYRVEGTSAVIGFIPSVSDDHFCSTCNRLRLTPEGKLRLCLVRDDEEEDLKKILRSPDYRHEDLKKAVARALERKRLVNGRSALRHSGCERKMFAIGG